MTARRWLGLVFLAGGVYFVTRGIAISAFAWAVVGTYFCCTRPPGG